MCNKLTWTGEQIVDICCNVRFAYNSILGYLQFVIMLIEMHKVLRN
jgi:hypothetical protein